LAEKGKKGIFRTKIQTWTTMPLKVGFIPGFKGLVTDWSELIDDGKGRMKQSLKMMNKKKRQHRLRVPASESLPLS
jgi:hypothetical protein